LRNLLKAAVNLAAFLALQAPSFGEPAKAASRENGGSLKNKVRGDEGWGKERRPVINVSWTDANEYLA